MFVKMNVILRFKIETLEIDVVLRPIYKRIPEEIQIPLSPLIKNATFLFLESCVLSL